MIHHSTRLSLLLCAGLLCTAVGAPGALADRGPKKVATGKRGKQASARLPQGVAPTPQLGAAGKRPVGKSAKPVGAMSAALGAQRGRSFDEAQALAIRTFDVGALGRPREHIVDARTSVMTSTLQPGGKRVSVVEVAREVDASGKPFVRFWNFKQAGFNPLRWLTGGSKWKLESITTNGTSNPVKGRSLKQFLARRTLAFTPVPTLDATATLEDVSFVAIDAVSQAKASGRPVVINQFFGANDISVVVNPGDRVDAVLTAYRDKRAVSEQRNALAQAK